MDIGNPESDLSLVSPPCFRSFYERITEYDGAHFRTELLAPWLSEHQARIAEWFAMIGEQPGEPYPALAADELWHLYAFSRVNDALLMDFQPFRPRAGAPEDWRERLGLRIDDYRDFVVRCGLELGPPRSDFTPFLHEIVSVEQSADDSEPIGLTAELWPAVMAGHMLISRGGACITAGRTHIVKEVAENSALYWAYLRRNRRCVDLSLGWGSNSQWRTSFRRDYLLPGLICLNVDADTVPMDDAEEEMTDRQRFELLVHRCLVTEGRPDDDDLWPYYDRFSGTPEDLMATATRA